MRRPQCRFSFYVFSHLATSIIRAYRHANVPALLQFRKSAVNVTESAAHAPFDVLYTFVAPTLLVTVAHHLVKLCPLFYSGFLNCFFDCFVIPLFCDYHILFPFSALYFAQRCFVRSEQ
jgi:hypothetical protein